MTEGTRLALVADVGATNVRFAISDVDEMTITHFAAFQTAEFHSLQEAISAYLKSVPFSPDMAGFAIATPIIDGKILLNNSPWSFTQKEIAQATGATRLQFINDFEALAVALPELSAHDLHTIGTGAKGRKSPRVVLGPGTGLGICSQVAGQSGWINSASEGGHATFAATDALEFEVMQHLSRHFAHVSVERVLSASGLKVIHGVLAVQQGRPEDDSLDAADIVQLAEREGDPLAKTALDCFVSVLARFAGDAALMCGAHGGVYLGGGIAPKIIKTLEAGAFLTDFQNKGRLSGYLKQIPIQVITAKDAGLRGVALALSERFPVPAEPWRQAAAR